MTNCPRCYQPLRRSDNGSGMSEGFPQGTVVLACRQCRQITVLGSGKWIVMDRDWRQGLAVLAAMAKQENDTTKAIMETPIEDPRWEAWV